MIRTMIALFILTLLVGCSKTVVPQTERELRTLTYSQIFDTATDLYGLCDKRVLDKPTCEDLTVKLRSVKDAIDNKGVTQNTMKVYEYIRSKL